MTKRREGMAGFYKVYRPDKVAKMEEAIELTREAAAAFGLQQLVVDEESTRVLPNGNLFVAIFGHTQKWLDRKAEEKRKAEPKKEDR